MKVPESKDPQVNEGSAEGEKAGSLGDISGDNWSSGDEWGTEERESDKRGAALNGERESNDGVCPEELFSGERGLRVPVRSG